MDWLKRKLGLQLKEEPVLRVALYPRSPQNVFLQVLVREFERFGVETIFLESLTPRSVWALKGRVDWLCVANVDPYRSPFAHEELREQTYRFAERLSALKLARSLGLHVAWLLYNEPETFLPHWFTLPGQTRLFDQADRVWCMGQASLDRFRHDWPRVASTRLRATLPPSCAGYYPDEGLTKAQALERLGLSDNAGKVFLCFGNVHPYKGLTDVIPLFRKQPLREHTLLVAGPPSTPQYAHAIEGLSSRMPGVRLTLRPIADTEVEAFLRAADFLVMPYKKVHNPGSLMLALAYGKAVIAPQIPAVTEWLTPANALFFRQAGGKALREALTEALTADVEAMSLHTRTQGERHHPTAVVREWLRDMVSFIPGKSLMEDYHDEV